MEKKQTVRDVQNVILEIIKYIDNICRKNNITYYIMGGTALGAVRHGGFIPWDDDLDIFMTPEEYMKFKSIFDNIHSKQYMLQEWRTSKKYLEYAKVRKNGTTFIEEPYKNRTDMHHGIYVDIMILHKVPENILIQRLVYFESKFVTLYALSQRNWVPKTKLQSLVLKSLKFLPCNWMTKIFYKNIYHYDQIHTNYKYCYWITPAKFKNGLFDADFFSDPIDIPFEDTILLGSNKIKEYLEYRYGNYMRLPSIEERREAVHALKYDVNKDYSEFI